MFCQERDPLALGIFSIRTMMENEEPLWSGIAVRMLINTVSHPIEYAKVLIQVKSPAKISPQKSEVKSSIKVLE